MRFLTFQVYVSQKDGDGLSLNNLYLELLDDKGVQKGSLGTSGINGATYGTVEVKTDKWVTVKLDLHKMKEQSGFNDNVQTIRVGDNYSRNIYFRNFTFIPKAVPSTMTGFTTDQKDIPGLRLRQKRSAGKSRKRTVHLQQGQRHPVGGRCRTALFWKMEKPLPSATSSAAAVTFRSKRN